MIGLPNRASASCRRAVVAEFLSALLCTRLPSCSREGPSDDYDQGSIQREVALKTTHDVRRRLREQGVPPRPSRPHQLGAFLQVLSMALLVLTAPRFFAR